MSRIGEGGRCAVVSYGLVGDVLSSATSKKLTVRVDLDRPIRACSTV